MPQWLNIAMKSMAGVVDRTIYTARKAISSTMMDLVTEPEKLRRC